MRRQRPTTHRSTSLVAALVVAVLAGCSQPAPNGGASSDAAGASGAAGAPDTAAPAGDQATERAALDSLMAAARALARTEGCASSGQCASMALGAKGCGGPWEYVVYCPLTTDTAALRATAEELERRERAFNAKYDVASTCEMLLEPRVEVVNGACRAASGAVPGDSVPGR
ncbi:MAG TPA: hypothetical protein VHQ45_19205 [Gemmatimonadaceae bacterium]|jgi:hypothetical protein|nr:hypothetical protein [Gemmatimonadaceae bacterium]